MDTKVEEHFEFEIPPNLAKINTGWRPPKELRKKSYIDAEYQRKQIGVIAVGKQIISPISNWKSMRLSRDFIDALYDLGKKEPTNIQMQSIPVALSGRDMITFAGVGNGKSWIPIIPITGLCLQEEKSMPIIRGEGPFAIFMAPSHDLASILFEKVSKFLQKLEKRNLIRLRCIRLIGGVDSAPNFEPMKQGIHIIVGTPARMLDLLRKRIYNLEYCKNIVLYEGFRLIDTAFNEDLYEILDQANKERQIILLSSAIPKKLDEFIQKYMKDPVIISQDYTTIPQFNVTQEVKYVKNEDKNAAILDALQKTAPQVIIFCENRKDVEAVHDFLIIKGIKSTAAHGNMDVNEKADALEYFKSGRSDILVTTDSVIKMIELENIKHIINYDMSRQIDGYITRITRAGKNVEKGHSTTFINKGTDYSALMDLKDLLTETKAELPHYLQMLEIRDNLECHYCGSRFHRYNRCRRKEVDKLVKFLNHEN